ncbi:hypothetical protein B0T21DRAFT_359641 [Apiosordaria backusii]|uniref:Uncharacterized protein n=1 Tax=Apiosordaria backusii TaxID=314023 RepID=A0AA40ETZ4_9PEZI|nr:hypothetical protein B0T21DRAFT_359641 [Apiosordaria backusii]
MASSTQLFYRLWQEETVRERFFELLSKQDICAVRVANSACCNLVTRRLFVRINLTFTPNTFTNPHRIQALSRIGHHIEHLSFTFPHSNATFLPPLIHPQTGQEILFLYNPHTSMASALTRPKYGNSELGDILTQQYPPLFHAASNVPSFINAMKHMTNMRHLTIKTPGQEPSERYRRDIVDYALISLRISVERAPLTKLTKLTLSGVHPSSFNYLRHKPGFGALPSAALRWRQIKKLYISVESWDFYGPAPGLDHLKIIDDYIRDFAPQLEKFSFTWLGRRGPCPIALSGDPLFAAPRHTKKLFNEVTSPMSPLPPKPLRHPLVMPKLRCMAVRNATMNAPQLKGLVASHRDTVREFDFDNVALVRGSWDDALGPLVDKDKGGSPDSWSRKSFASGRSNMRPGTSRSNTSIGSAVANPVEDEAVTPSSAAAEASRELFEVDLEGMVFGGVNDVDNFEAGVEEWARGVTAAAAAAPVSINAEVDDYDDGGLASDIEAAKQASEGFTTTLRKRRLRKKRRHHDHDEEDDRKSDKSVEKEKEKSAHHHPSIGKSSSKLTLKHFRSRSDETPSTTNKETRDRERSQSRPRLQRRRRHHRHHSSDDALPALPAMPSMPEVVGSDDESYFNSHHPYYASPGPSTPPPLTRSNSLSSSHSVSPSPSPARNSRGSSRIEISVPILNPDPFPVLLQPTVYDPSAKAGPFVCSIAGEEEHGLYEDDGLSPAQRLIEADMLAEAREQAARSSALKRAREAVMTKLSREFSKKANANSEKNKGSAAVQQVAGMMSIADLPLHPLHTGGSNSNNNVNGSSGSIGYRIREGLFGRSSANVAECTKDQQRVTMESNGSALVPLIFARS